ncbi:beta-glucosidase [Phyllosticta capitalensis]
MRLTSLVAVTATLITAVSAGGRLGFSLGTKKPDGSCKTQQDYEDDFDAIKTNANSTLVRGYSASDCNVAQNILPAAKAKGVQVMLGVWPDTDESFNADKEALQKYATEEFAKQLYGVTVGSECLYRGNFTGEQLLDKINEVKRIIPKGVKCGTADSWNKWADGTGDAIVKGGVDLILANGFAYWQATPIANASATYFYDMASAIAHIQTVAGGPEKAPEIYNGETGWPTTGGSSYGPAQASTDDAEIYYSQSICGMLTWGVNVFMFEAIDEPWKPDSVGQNGQSADEKHWGAMGADRKPKFDLSCKPV